MSHSQTCSNYTSDVCYEQQSKALLAAKEERNQTNIPIGIIYTETETETEWTCNQREPFYQAHWTGVRIFRHRTPRTIISAWSREAVKNVQIVAEPTNVGQTTDVEPAINADE
jgi:hypothetical protein